MNKSMKKNPKMPSDKLWEEAKEIRCGMLFGFKNPKKRYSKEAIDLANEINGHLGRIVSNMEKV